MIEYFETLGLLSVDELKLLDGLPKINVLKKGDFLIKEGKVCNEVILIKSGIFRSFYNSYNGEEITNCITFENEFMSAFSSFITQQPTDENIQALCDSEYYSLSRKDIEFLYSSSLSWQKIGKILTEMQYVELEKRIVSFQKLTAKERYENLITNRPEYIKLIPLQYLASYLGITPRHLSRLRKSK